MFYLTKRVDEKQCFIGDRCMVLADFSGIPAGTRGTVTEIYDKGVMVEWDQSRSDGFSRDDLQYLAFETLKHPDVYPKVNRA